MVINYDIWNLLSVAPEDDTNHAMENFMTGKFWDQYYKPDCQEKISSKNWNKNKEILVLMKIAQIVIFGHKQYK